MSEALHAGACALQDLIRQIGAKGDADLSAADEPSGDARDYRAMAEIVQRDLSTNLDHPSTDHRQGYLRALTHLLSLTADGFGPGNDWDPIRDTASAFARPT